jgi:hypothetical protein
VTFPQKSGKDAVRLVSNIILPDGANGKVEGEDPLPKYDETMEIPFTKFHAGSNVALLVLESPIKLDGSECVLILGSF